MSNKKPFIEFGEDFKYGFLMFVFTLITISLIITFFALFVTFIQAIGGNWTNFYITLSIFIVNILFFNIKRIGNLENPFYVLWRTPLDDL